MGFPFFPQFGCRVGEAGKYKCNALPFASMGCTPSVSSLAFVLAKIVAYCSTSFILSLARTSSGPPHVIYVSAPTMEKNFLEVPWLVGGMHTQDCGQLSLSLGLSACSCECALDCNFYRRLREKPVMVGCLLVRRRLLVAPPLTLEKSSHFLGLEMPCKFWN